MRVCVLTSPTGNSGLQVSDPNAERQTMATRDAVRKSLGELGHQVRCLEVGPSVWQDLADDEPDLVFNMATGYRSKQDQAAIAGILELSGIPFTGSSSSAHVLGLQKHLAKIAMGERGVATPDHVVLLRSDDISPGYLERLNYPVIVKPGAEGSSVGINQDSVVADPGAAAKAASGLMERLGPPVLVEEFISGREFTVGILGYPDPVALPIQEVIFHPEDGMYTYAVKVKDKIRTQCPADISPDLAATLGDMAVGTFLAIGCRDIGRVDIRLSKDGVPYVLEINTLPGLEPGFSDFPRVAQAGGFSYTQMIGAILEGAIKRKVQGRPEYGKTADIW